MNAFLNCFPNSNLVGLLSHDEFINRCLNRGYNKFQLGDLLTIDVSDFTTADYKTLLSNLNHIIKN